jgi:hypothetical protein
VAVFAGYVRLIKPVKKCIMTKLLFSFILLDALGRIENRGCQRPVLSDLASPGN